MPRASLPTSVQALRRHRLPRFWLAATLGLVVGGIGLVYWWERQLPHRLETAAREGNLDACLRYSDQLMALRWMSGAVPIQQGQCRRQKARRLWGADQWRPALDLQRQLVHSAAGTEEDRDRLLLWQHRLETTAMRLFRDGDLNAALRRLAAIGEDRRPDGSALGNALEDQWKANRFYNERATRLLRAKRYWEALDALDRIDHPWWRRQSVPLRQQLEREMEQLKAGEAEHDGHGSLPHSVPTDQLEALVQKKLVQGLGEWQAFRSACADLGGRVVEAGPDTACQR